MLIPDHYNTLHVKSAIAEEMIALRGYDTLTTPGEVPELYRKGSAIHKYLTQEKSAGIIMPIYDIDGEIVSYDFRADEPIILRETRPDGSVRERPTKYLRPAGVPNYADFGKNFNSNSDVYIFTEGVKKGDCLRSYTDTNYTIGIAGVYGYLRNRSLTPELETLAYKGKLCQLFFDSDIATNRKVKDAIDRFYRELTERGARVEIIYLPQMGEKIGIDDYLANYVEIDGMCAHQLEMLKRMSKSFTMLNPIPLKKWRVTDYREWLTQEGWRLYFNEMDKAPYVLQGKQKKKVRLDDYHISTMRARVYDESQNKGQLEDVLLLLAAEQPYHPLKEVFEKLTKPASNPFEKIDEYFAIEGGDFGHLLEMFCRCAVAKVYDTGIVRNFVPVLVSPKERLGKSSFIRWLCSPFPDHYSDAPFEVKDKDSRLAMASRFLWELSEIAQITRKQDRDALKHTLTLQLIDERPPFGKAKMRMPVTVNFMATANNSSFLDHNDKNTRFFAVKVDSIDWQGYVKHIDPAELWGWAYHTYLEGLPYELDEADVTRQRKENERVTQISYIEDTIFEQFRLWGSKEGEEGESPINFCSTLPQIIKVCEFSGVEKRMVADFLKNLEAEGKIGYKRTNIARLWVGLRVKEDVLDLNSITSAVGAAKLITDDINKEA